MRKFDSVWLVDTEYNGKPGDIVHPVCLVAYELYSQRIIRLWEDGLSRLKAPPYPIDQHNLFVAYYSPAELGFHLALGWKLPVRILDLWLEFRWLTNGERDPEDPKKYVSTKLVRALEYFLQDTIGLEEKKEMVELILRGGPWSGEEKRLILEYCESDVVGLRKLLPIIVPRVDLEDALYRSQYMRGVAYMEHWGVPIDPLHHKMNDHWDAVRNTLVRGFDPHFEIFDADLEFQYERFARWLNKRGMPWPCTPSGRLSTSEDTFEEMVRIYPAVRPIWDALHALSITKLNKLAVGSDGRNRVMLSPYGARSSRNLPSNSKFIFGPSVWIRSLIKPPYGKAVAYVDWSQQEGGIAAVLSGDANMLECYSSQDAYIAFAILAKALPPGSKKKGNEAVREIFKQCWLGVNYGMQEYSLAFRIAQPVIVARNLLQAHHESFPRFWKWSNAAVNFGCYFGYQDTVFKWRNRCFPDPNLQSLRNFPMQANGAEMLRIAICLAIQWGVKVIAPVHDALLIEADLASINHAVWLTKQAMAEASRQVLSGFELKTDEKIFAWRYWDKRGLKTFLRIYEHLRSIR